MLARRPRPSVNREALLAERARGMRAVPTSSEVLLWAALRGWRLGVRFVRQAVIGPFIVDVLAPEVRLVVEVDGGYHAERGKADERRDEKLRRWGYRVVRVEAVVLLRRPAVAVDRVRMALRRRNHAAHGASTTIESFPYVTNSAAPPVSKTSKIGCDPVPAINGDAAPKESVPCETVSGSICQVR